jgi:hypothetical protein
MTCRDCGSDQLAWDGKRFRTRCRECHNAAQRRAWALNREKNIERSRANYAKNAEKRRAEAAAYKAANREYYTLAEWFRRKKIPISHLDRSNLQALIDMKKAVKEAKAVANVDAQTPLT